MRKTFAAVGGRVLCAAAAAALLAACDDDPNGPQLAALQGNFSINADTIGTQEAIRVAFNAALNPATALDPANFVVINTCSGLRVAGSIRLSPDGRTLTFTPTQALPFLTPLAIRVQNVLGLNGAALSEPITFSLITQQPPVSDLSWAFLNSPTNDALTGVAFVSDSLGYVLAGASATVFRTDNGGTAFAAIFKNIDITDAFNLRALTADSLYMLATVTVNGQPQSGLLKSTNGGLSFDTVRTVPQSRFSTLSIRRSGTNVVGLAAGISSSPLIFRYSSATNSFASVGGVPGPFGPGGFRIPLGADLSPNVANAAVAIGDFDNTGAGHGGEVLRSTDGGQTFSLATTLPTHTPVLQGANFINDTDVLLVGDSSTVLRMNVVTGAVTAITNGIPTTVLDTLTGQVTTFSFFRSEWTKGGQVGYIIGRVTVQPRTGPASIRGVVLFSGDGGASWRRQGIVTAPNNGLDFPPVLDIQARSENFATIVGNNGFVARNSGNVASVAACSFNPR